MQRYGDRDDPESGLDLNLISGWFSNQHSVVLDKMLRRMLRCMVGLTTRLGEVEAEQEETAQRLHDHMQHAAPVASGAASWAEALGPAHLIAEVRRGRCSPPSGHRTALWAGWKRAAVRVAPPRRAEAERNHKINKVLREWRHKTIAPVFGGWKGCSFARAAHAPCSPDAAPDDITLRRAAVAAPPSPVSPHPP